MHTEEFFELLLQEMGENVSDDQQMLVLSMVCLQRCVPYTLYEWLHCNMISEMLGILA